MDYNRKTELLLWIGCALTATLDLLSTKYGLESGFREKNPIGELLITESGFYSLIGAKVVIMLFCYCVTVVALDGKYRYISPALIFIIWGAAAVLNTMKLI